MRRSILALSLFLAGCAARPSVPAEIAPPVPAPQSPVISRQLIGLTATELVGHFGSPALQVREGTSLKLQFRGKICVLDAYLYPSQGGALRVTYVDTRATSGADSNQAACISALENPS